jgi:hypothetical protein
MRKSGTRKTPSVYARLGSASSSSPRQNVNPAPARAAPAATVTSAAAGGSNPASQRASDSAALLNISTQMSQFAEGLAAAQRSFASTEALMCEKFEEQKRIIDENKSAAQAESKALSSSLQVQFQHAATNFSWKSKGNEAQYVYNCTDLNNWIEVATAQECDDHDAAKTFVRKGIKAVVLRNKCCKLADASPAGWGLVEEYLANSLAEDDDDDRKIRRCETAALDKKRRRLDDAANNSNGNSNNNRRGRGGKQGAGRGKPAATETVSEVVPASAPAPALDPFTLAILTSSLQAFASSPLNPGKANQRKLGPCFVCQGDHLQNDCPYVKGQRAAYQQQLAASIANAPGNTK